MRQDEEGWIILRTSGGNTLRLARTLREDGFEVWSPAGQRMIRVPRFNARRPVSFPLLPSFVFARSRHMLDLLDLAAMPERPRRGPGGREPAHAAFSVFHSNDRIPVIAEADLDALRLAEAGPGRRRSVRRYAHGAKVRIVEGSFGGLTGTVVQSDERVTLVAFGRNWQVKIETSILRQNDAHDASDPAGASRASGGGGTHGPVAPSPSDREAQFSKRGPEGCSAPRREISETRQKFTDRRPSGSDPAAL